MVNTQTYAPLNPSAEGLDAQQLRRKIRNFSEKLGDNPKPLLEARIVDLRARLAQAYPEPKPNLTPEDRFKTDMFASVNGLPEIDAKDLTPEAVASGVLFHGALIVRGLYNAEQIAFLSKISEIARNQKRDDPQSVTSTYSFCKLMDIYEECGLLDVVKGYIGDDAVIALKRARLRYKAIAGKSGISWHQDGSYFGQKCFSLNCWAAVTECGRKNNGLTLVARRNHECLGVKEVDESKVNFGKADLDYGKNFLAKFLPNKNEFIEPFFEPGDAILFDEMTLHRTAVVANPTMHQIVSISWFFSRSRFPKFKTPLGF